MKETFLPSEELTKRFTYHNPTPEMMQKFVVLRGHALVFADIIDQSCPDGREKALALTKIEEAVGWANAAVARHPNA